jgi:hypothetical protein
LSGKAVQIRSVRHWVTGCAHAIATVLIRHDQQDIGPTLRLGIFGGLGLIFRNCTAGIKRIKPKGAYSTRRAV